MWNNESKRILIAPLDWGLGHTTRCVPLIRYLLELKHTPVFAGNQWQQAFITATFPGIETVFLEGYNIKYAETHSTLILSLLKQIPGFLRRIKAEHDWLINITEGTPFDGIISDNRYGLFHPHIPSVILTHQVNILSGFGPLLDRIVNKYNHKLLKQFKEIWIVDSPESPGLAGSLSHPPRPLKRSKYIGHLTQMEPIVSPTEKHLLILLSGPEPQRSILSKILWEQAMQESGPIVFVEGSDSAVSPKDIPPHIKHYSRLTRDQLAPIVSAAAIVICRSGYSTIMDLVAAQKRAILIPTPGQPEQEYLALLLQKSKLFYSEGQKGFNITSALTKAQLFFKTPSSHFAPFPILYKAIISDWVAKLSPYRG